MNLDIPTETAAFERNLRARNRSPHTIATYRRAIDQLTHYLHRHEHSVTEAVLNRATIEDLLNEAQSRGLSPTTLAQWFRSLQQFTKYVATETDQLSPMTNMTPPHVTITPPPVLTPAQLTHLFNTCTGRSFADCRDLALLSLFADTGIRRGEMADIKTTDLHLDEQVVIVTGKTGTRGVPYGSTTATRLDRYLRARRQHPASHEPWLWLGRKGRFTIFGIEGIVETRGRAAGLDLNPHLFRHTFAHLWLDGGGNEGDLQRLAGWTSGQMLQRYGASAASARARRAYLAGRSPVDKLRTP